MNDKKRKTGNIVSTFVGLLLLLGIAFFLGGAVLAFAFGLMIWLTT